VNQQLNGQFNLWIKRDLAITQEMIAEFLKSHR
jgi:hypothetical protein